MFIVTGMIPEGSLCHSGQLKEIAFTCTVAEHGIMGVVITSMEDSVV